jgi:hypothetical protein
MTKNKWLLLLCFALLSQVQAQQWGLHAHVSRAYYGGGIGTTSKSGLNYDTSLFSSSRVKSTRIFDFSIGVNYTYYLNLKSAIVADFQLEQNNMGIYATDKNDPILQTRKKWVYYTPLFKVGYRHVISDTLGLYVSASISYSRAIWRKRSLERATTEIPMQSTFPDQEGEFIILPTGPAFTNNILGYAIEFGLPLQKKQKSKSPILYLQFTESITPISLVGWGMRDLSSDFKIIGIGYPGRIQANLGYRYLF